MDRRTFVLLTGGVSSRLIVPPSTALHRPPPSGVAGGGRLRFELDDRRRWSLWYYGDGAPVPLIRDADVVTWLADRALGLAELEDSTVGSRRPPRGDAREAWVGDGRGALEAASQWLATRPLRPEGDGSRMRLAFDPQGDGLTALRALFVPSSPVDQDRLAQAVAPAGWCSRQELAAGVSEADVVANTEFCAASFDRRVFRYIELDDGYQRAAGAWGTKDKVPHGHAGRE